MPIGPERPVERGEYPKMLARVEAYLDDLLPTHNYIGSEKRVPLLCITGKCGCDLKVLTSIHRQLQIDYLQAGWHKVSIASRPNGSCDDRGEDNTGLYLVFTR